VRLDDLRASKEGNMTSIETRLSAMRKVIRGMCSSPRTKHIAWRSGLGLEDLEAIGLAEVWMVLSDAPDPIVIADAYLYAAARRAIARKALGQGRTQPPVDVRVLGSSSGIRMDVDPNAAPGANQPDPEHELVEAVDAQSAQRRSDARLTLAWMERARVRSMDAAPRRGRPPRRREETRKRMFEALAKDEMDEVVPDLARERGCTTESIRQEVAHTLLQMNAVAL
jgi:hypothetical protein